MEKAKYNVINARNQQATCRVAYESDLPEPLPEGPEQKEADLAHNIFFVFPHTAPLATRLEQVETEIEARQMAFELARQYGDGFAASLLFKQQDKLLDEKDRIERQLDAFHNSFSQKDRNDALSHLEKQREDRRKQFKTLKESIRNHTREEKWWLEVLRLSCWLLRHGRTKANLTDPRNPFKTARELTEFKNQQGPVFKEGEPLDTKFRRLTHWASQARKQANELLPISPKLAQEALEDAKAFNEELNILSCNPFLSLNPPFTPPKHTP